MKAITVKLADEVAGAIARDAKAKGLTSEELCKYILGLYAQENLASFSEQLEVMFVEAEEYFGKLRERYFNKFRDNRLTLLKGHARQGALSCKNCTIKLSEQDIDDGKCGACGVPLATALGENNPQP